MFFFTVPILIKMATLSELCNAGRVFSGLTDFLKKYEKPSLVIIDTKNVAPFL